VIAPDALVEKHTEGFVGIGSAWQVYQTPLQQRITASHNDFFQNIYPSAASIAYLAVPQYKNNQYIYAETGEIQPVYLRNKVAQTLIERSKA
jgi:tRNA A37 threonylcarbamoyladenosine modification protein TsaB